MENPKFRDELVRKFGRMATPTIIIDHDVILGFGINKAEIIKRLNLRKELE